MDLATVKKLREEAEERGLPIMIITDNAKTFYDYAVDKFPLLWDDENEILTGVFINDDYRYLDEKYVISSVHYNEIQYFNTPISRKDLIKWMKEQSYTEEQKKRFMDLVKGVNVMGNPPVPTEPKRQPNGDILNQ